MHARVPLDVDLEDKLMYGLTPARLGYLVVALLGGFTLWSSHWAPEAGRGIASVSLVGIGAVLAWGRWQRRPLDAWLSDAAWFAARRYRLAWKGRQISMRWPARWH